MGRGGEGGRNRSSSRDYLPRLDLLQTVGFTSYECNDKLRRFFESALNAQLGKVICLDYFRGWINLPLSPCLCNTRDNATLEWENHRVSRNLLALVAGSAHPKCATVRAFLYTNTTSEDFFFF